MNAAIHFEGDAFTIPEQKPMGRHYAGFGFLSAFSRHASAEAVTGFVKNDRTGRHFQSVVENHVPSRRASFITSQQVSKLNGIGCLFTPSIITASQVWERHVHGPRSWSLTGVNHTLSSALVMDALASFPTLPFQPWDALICTSKASREVVSKLLQRQAEYLVRHLGATRFTLPQLPVIPLGVNCEERSNNIAQRPQARASLGIGTDDIVVLFLGRLSFHAKANPVPMYLALERLCARHRVVLIECGWFANEAIEKAFEEARAKLCPSVRSIVLDGRNAEISARAWSASDIFCSLSDNIQETFGLTPIEAMASGLPVIVSDWDGYKDTVRNGVDGFTIPTLSAPPGTGHKGAIRHALEIDSYDVYIGQASTGTAVDIDATAQAFESLAADPELRRRMGAAGAARAREAFDWKVIVRSYERLWEELASLRNAENNGLETVRSLAKAWPARPDPFELFASFPSALLSLRHVVRVDPSLDVDDAAERLSLKASMLSAFGHMSEAALLQFWQGLGPEEKSVEAILENETDVSKPVLVHALLLLSKIGLIRIDGPSE
ncbi:glycosyltransferase family 4 protein [Microvirga sp. 2MCAF38]|uniref:glycosyltransferase family 4 protein n=1 Tax=Microvirga sp. 2MCAF38 TaxID=3232989 RepID=UPI003F958E9B